jgi:hypothetical protein
MCIRVKLYEVKVKRKRLHVIERYLHVKNGVLGEHLITARDKRVGPCRTALRVGVCAILLRLYGASKKSLHKPGPLLEIDYFT